MWHAQALEHAGGFLQRLARSLGLGVRQPLPGQKVAAGGVEGPLQLEPDPLRPPEELGSLEWVGGGCPERVEGRGLADRVAQALGQAAGLVGRFPSLLELAGLEERERARRDGLDRLRDEAGALAYVERLVERRNGAGEVAAVAQGHGQ